MNNILILLILLGMSAFCSLSETAIFSVSRLKARHLADKNKRGSKRLLQLKENPRFVLITILTYNNLVNILASSIATSIAIGYFKNNAIGIATGVMTLLILTFGEILPKSLAAQNAQPIALFVSNIVWYMGLIITPVIKFFEILNTMVLKIFGAQKKTPLVTEEEIKSFIKVGQEEGTIDEMEKRLIDNVFKFDDISASEIMTPRTDMVVLKADSTLKEVSNHVMKNAYSRIPVIEKSKDKIVGILNTKDLMQHLDKPNKKVRDIMREPYFIPETKKIDSLLRQFQKRKEHIAVVIDEHGGVAGIVTLEDVLEEIVGEIFDETEKSKQNIMKKGKNEWLVSAKTDIEELNERLKTEFKVEEDYDTLGGFILKRLGRFPKVGEEIDDGNIALTIESCDQNRINEVRLIKK